jgi:uncharacterized protein (TIGR03067 family)
MWRSISKTEFKQSETAMAKMSITLLAIGVLTVFTGLQPGAKLQPELAKLQGTWSVVALETEGTQSDAKLLKGAKIVVQGNTFTTMGMGPTFQGTINLDAASSPKKLDLEFTDGPPKGTKALAIYDLDGDTWKICLTLTATDRPKEFAARAGSGLVLETLKREPAAQGHDAKEDLAKLQGEWTMVSGEIAGQQLPPDLVKTSKRVTKANETTAHVGGQLFFKATITLDPTKKPKTIDYDMTEGTTKGKKQLGIYEITGDTIRFCFSAPGKERPTDFTTKAGDERTLSAWKKGK